MGALRVGLPETYSIHVPKQTNITKEKAHATMLDEEKENYAEEKL